MKDTAAWVRTATDGKSVSVRQDVDSRKILIISSHPAIHANQNSLQLIQRYAGLGFRM